MNLRSAFTLVFVFLIGYSLQAQHRGFLFGLEASAFITKSATYDLEGKVLKRTEQQHYLGGFNVGFQWNDKHAIILGYRIGEQSEYREDREQLSSYYYFDPNVIDLIARYRLKHSFGKGRFGLLHDFGYRYTRAMTGRAYLNSDNMDLLNIGREIRQQANTVYYTPRFYFQMGRRCMLDLALISLEGQSKLTFHPNLETVHDEHIAVNLKRPTIGFHYFLPIGRQGE